jgi:hypothetical protein
MEAELEEMNQVEMKLYIDEKYFLNNYIIFVKKFCIAK